MSLALGLMKLMFDALSASVSNAIVGPMSVVGTIVPARPQLLVQPILRSLPDAQSLRLPDGTCNHESICRQEARVLPLADESSPRLASP